MELALGPADFSPVKLDVSSNSTDASHPWKITSILGMNRMRIIYFTNPFNYYFSFLLYQ